MIEMLPQPVEKESNIDDTIKGSLYLPMPIRTNGIMALVKGKKND